MANSKHLDEIMVKHNHVANLQVVFVDIEKYSKRRTKTQTEVIERFTTALRETLTFTSKEYVEYSQANQINFQEDIITIPTGDGAAVVFSFNGLSEIHLFFATQLLEQISKMNAETPCDKFGEQGWCNCHANFGVRIGISQDNGIIYRDINENYNVAGNVINMAARVMGLAEKNQIIFTQEAFKQIIDMVDEPDLVDHFREFPKVRLKHGIEQDVHQYIGRGEEWISSEAPEQLGLMLRADKAMETFTAITGMPRPSPDEGNKGLSKMVGLMEAMGSLFTEASDAQPKNVIDVKSKVTDDDGKPHDKKA